MKFRDEKIFSLGSCFASEIGQRMKDSGYDIMVNPFGVMFNPVSIGNILKRIATETLFEPGDVVQRAPLAENAIEDKRPEKERGYVSFAVHGSFTCPSEEEFIVKANEMVLKSREHLKESSLMLVTLGTAKVYRYVGNACEKFSGKVVANCHKHPAGDFCSEFLSLEEVVETFRPMIKATAAESDDFGRPKKWIFTVSPVRHLSDGLHENAVSKSTLILAAEALRREFPDRVDYFEAYEIMVDQMRDYSHYAADRVHPSRKSADLIYRRFVGLPDRAQSIVEIKTFLRQGRHKKDISTFVAAAQKASDFQIDVWRALCDIPRGHTVSYSQLAILSGHPGAARAVGGALGQNPLPRVIPCHRVIRRDGTLGGFALGVEEKQRLLVEENSLLF